MTLLRGPYLWPTVARRWTADLALRPETRRDYERTLRLLHQRAARRRPGARFNEITPDDVADFVHFKEDGSPRADRSRSKYLGTVWAVYAWAADPEVGLVTTNPAARLKARRARCAPRDARRKTWLTEDQARAFLASVKADPTMTGRRDHFVIGMYLYTGLRLSELLRVRWRDIDLSAGRHGVLHVTRKGGKLAQVALSPAAHRLIFAWRSEFIAGHGSDRVADLFIVPQLRSNIVGRPCRAGAPRELVVRWDRGLHGPATVQAMVSARAAAAGLRVAPHDLRRSLAGMLKDAGADIDDIRQALGHEHVATTEIYLSRKPELAPAAEALDIG